MIGSMRFRSQDFIIIGEGEVAFKDLLTELSREQNFKELAFIAIVKLEKIIQLDRKLDLKDNSPIDLEDLDALAKRVVYIETSRGCHLTANFVSSRLK